MDRLPGKRTTTTTTMTNDDEDQGKDRGKRGKVAT
jgi:hypothetical protein